MARGHQEHVHRLVATHPNLAPLRDVFVDLEAPLIDASRADVVRVREAVPAPGAHCERPTTIAD